MVPATATDVGGGAIGAWETASLAGALAGGRLTTKGKLTVLPGLLAELLLPPFPADEVVGGFGAGVCSAVSVSVGGGAELAAAASVAVGLGVTVGVGVLAGVGV